MGTARTIAKNTIFIAAAEIVTKILFFVLSILLARYLGDIGFGKFSLALAFPYLFIAFADFGLGILTIREVSRDRTLASKYLGNLTLAKLVLSIATFLFIVIVINAMNYPSDTVAAVYILGGYLIVDSFNAFLRSIFRAFEKMLYEAVVRILERALTFGLVVWFIHLQYGLLPISLSFVISVCIGFILTAALVMKKFARPRFEIDKAFLKKALSEAWPFAITGLLTMLYFRVDTVMLSAMKGDAEVGWYNAAYNIIFGLTFIPWSYIGAVFPVMSRYFNSSKDSLFKLGVKSFKYLTIVGFPISIGVTLLASRIMSLLYGEEYANGVLALQILIWSFFAMCLCGTLTATLNSMNKQRIVAIGMSITVVLNIILNFILIPKYSLMGAAVATLVVCVFEFFFELYYTRKYAFKLMLKGQDIIKIIAINLLLGLFIFYVDTRLSITITLSIVIYTALILLAKVISKEDIKIIKDIISTKQRM